MPLPHPSWCWRPLTPRSSGTVFLWAVKWITHYDNAAAETVMGLYKNEAVAKNSPFWVGPLKTIADIRRSSCPIVGRAVGLQAAIAFE